MAFFILFQIVVLFNNMIKDPYNMYKTQLLLYSAPLSGHVIFYYFVTGPHVSLSQFGTSSEYKALSLCMQTACDMNEHT